MFSRILLMSAFEDVTLLEFFQLVDAAQEGALPGAGRTDDADYFAGQDVQVGALDDFVNAVVALVQVSYLNLVFFFHGESLLLTNVASSFECSWTAR